MDVIDRLNRFFQAKNLTNYQAEKVCGLSNGYFRSVRKAPSEKVLESVLSAFPDLNREWLLNGNGKMLNNNIVPATTPKDKGEQISEDVLRQRQERFVKLYEYAIDQGLCKNKTGFALLANTASNTMSKAFSGEALYLTDNLLIRINDALGNPFCLDWLIHGTLPIYRSEIDAQPYENKVEVFQSTAEDGKNTPRYERLNSLYEYARTHGVCKTKKDLATLLGMNYTGLSRSFSQDEFVTNALLIKANELLGSPFTLDWLIDGVEPIYRADRGNETAGTPETQQPMSELLAAKDAIISQQQQLIDALKECNTLLKSSMSKNTL